MKGRSPRYEELNAPPHSLDLVPRVLTVPLHLAEKALDTAARREQCVAALRLAGVLAAAFLAVARCVATFLPEAFLAATAAEAAVLIFAA